MHQFKKGGVLHVAHVIWYSKPYEFKNIEVSIKCIIALFSKHLMHFNKLYICICQHTIYEAIQSMNEICMHNITKIVKEYKISYKQKYRKRYYFSTYT